MNTQSPTNLTELKDYIGGTEKMADVIGISVQRMRQIFREEEDRILLKYLPELNKATKLPIETLYGIIYRGKSY